MAQVCRAVVAQEVQPVDDLGDVALDGAGEQERRGKAEQERHDEDAEHQRAARGEGVEQVPAVAVSEGELRRDELVEPGGGALEGGDGLVLVQIERGLAEPVDLLRRRVRGDPVRTREDGRAHAGVLREVRADRGEGGPACTVRRVGSTSRSRSATNRSFAAIWSSISLYSCRSTPLWWWLSRWLLSSARFSFAFARARASSLSGCVASVYVSCEARTTCDRPVIPSSPMTAASASSSPARPRSLSWMGRRRVDVVAARTRWEGRPRQSSGRATLRAPRGSRSAPSCRRQESCYVRASSEAAGCESRNLTEESPE